jgi:hypothetical protein
MGKNIIITESQLDDLLKFVSNIITGKKLGNFDLSTLFGSSSTSSMGMSTDFNKMVDKIFKYIDNLLNINRDYIYQKIDLLNFNDYFNIEFDRDAAGEIYPQTEIDFGQSETSSNKKGKNDKNFKK